MVSLCMCLRLWDIPSGSPPQEPHKITLLMSVHASWHIPALSMCLALDHIVCVYDWFLNLCHSATLCHRWQTRAREVQCVSHMCVGAIHCVFFLFQFHTENGIFFLSDMFDWNHFSISNIMESVWFFITQEEKRSLQRSGWHSARSFMRQGVDLDLELIILFDSRIFILSFIGLHLYLEMRLFRNLISSMCKA